MLRFGDGSGGERRRRHAGRRGGPGIAATATGRGRCPTMRDIAQAAGVSQSTVSRVLNDVPTRVPIAPETRERVTLAASQLGYRPNPLARGLRGASTMLLGAVVRDITDPFFAGAIEALSVAANSHGYNLVLGHARGRRGRRHRPHGRPRDPPLRRDRPARRPPGPAPAVRGPGRRPRAGRRAVAGLEPARGADRRRRQRGRHPGRARPSRRPRPRADRVRERPAARRHPRTRSRIHRVHGPPASAASPTATSSTSRTRPAAARRPSGPCSRSSSRRRRS